MGDITRSSARFRPCQEARVVDHGWYVYKRNTLVPLNGSDCTQVFALISDVFLSARLEILAAGSVPATAHTTTSLDE
jgi:hypothetical protein